MLVGVGHQDGLERFFFNRNLGIHAFLLIDCPDQRFQAVIIRASRSLLLLLLPLRHLALFDALHVFEVGRIHARLIKEIILGIFGEANLSHFVFPSLRGRLLSQQLSIKLFLDLLAAIDLDPADVVSPIDLGQHERQDRQQQCDVGQPASAADQDVDQP